MNMVPSAHPAAERLAVHAAMEAVTREGAADASDFLERLREIIRYGVRCPDANGSFSIITNDASGGSFSGHAAGVGDIQIGDGSDGRAKERRYFSPEPDRVGGYRLERSSRCIEFYPFWDAAALQAVDPRQLPPSFSIRYDETTLEPKGFYARTWDIAFRIPLWILTIIFFGKKTDRIWGEPCRFTGAVQVRICRHR
jgi:hypothetical protein